MLSIMLIGVHVGINTVCIFARGQEIPTSGVMSSVKAMRLAASVGYESTEPDVLGASSVAALAFTLDLSCLHFQIPR